VPVVEVAPGTYRLMCSALGFSGVFGPPIPLRAGEIHEETCRLTPLTYLPGKVVASGSAEPIPGARLTPLDLHVLDGRWELSPTGTAHLLKNLVAVSDSEGHFLLPGLPGTTVSVWIEAKNFSAQVLPGILFGGRDRDVPRTIVLEQGGGLEVWGALSDHGRAENLRIGLRPHATGADVPQEVAARALDLRVWVRRLSSTEGRIARWDSLPPGPYEVVLTHTPDLRTSFAPVVLGQVTVEIGSLSRLAVEPGKRSPSEPRQPLVRPPPFADLFFFLSGEQAVPEDGWGHGLTATAFTGALMRESARFSSSPPERTSGGYRFRFADACRPGLYSLSRPHSLARPRWISPIVDVTKEDCTGSKAIPTALHPAGVLIGHLATPAGFARPTSALFEVEACDRDSPGAAGARSFLGAYPIELLEHGRFRAAVPAGCLNLTLRARGFAPLFWEGVGLTQGQTENLGRPVLSAGAALLTRIVSGQDGRPLGDIRVALIPEQDLARVAEGVLEGQEPPSRPGTRSDREGWVRLRDLPYGRFALLAWAPETILAMSEIFTLHRGEEALPADLEVPSSARLTVSLEGEAGELGDEERLELSFDVHLAGCGWISVASLRQTIQPGASIDLPALLPGTWRLRVWLRSAGSSRYPLLRREIELGPGEIAELVLPLTGRRYRGTLLYRKTPLQAELAFQPRQWSGSPARTVSDELGNFHLFVPRGGLFDVEVQSDLPELRVTVPAVRLEDPEEPVEIHLPGGEIRGRVMDRGGLPVAGAWVEARQASPDQAWGGEEGTERPSLLSSLSRGAGDGGFELLGLAPGDWEVEAWTEAARSRRERLSLGDGELIPALELALEAPTVVRGRLLAEGLPAAGVPGRATAFAADGTPVATLARFVTGDDGRFALELSPRRAVAVQLLVLGPGRPVAAFRLTLGEEQDEEVEIHLPTRAGRLEISLPPDWRTILDFSRAALVRQDGAFFNLPAVPELITREASDGSVRLILPNLAPGVWAFVQPASPEQMQAVFQGAGLAVPHLADFELVPEETVYIDLALPGLDQ